MKCDVLLDDLKAYFDGELSLVRRAAIGAHVSHCPACREEVEVMERMSNELKAGDVAALPAELRDRLIAAAPDGAAVETQPEIPLWRRRSMQIWAGAAATLAVWFILFPVFAPAWEAKRSVAARSTFWGGVGAVSPASAPREPEAQSPGGATAGAGKMSGIRMADRAAGGFGGKALGMGLEMYSQDYDHANPTVDRQPQRIANASMPSATSLPHAVAGRPAFGDGHAKVREYEKYAHHPDAFRMADARGYSREISRQEPPEIGKSKPSVLERDVKKTGELTVEVARLEAASDSVEEMVKESGGYVANNQLTTGEDGIKAASLEVKVPVNLFDSMMSRFSKLGEVKAKNVTGEDLTEQISDEKQAKRALGDELDESRQKLQQAKSKRDKREADQEVRDLKVQIAQAEGRLELLKKQARLSTISISLREKSKAQPKPVTGGFLDDLKDSGREALASFTSAARIPFVLMVWLLAYSPVWVPLAFGYRYAAKAHRKKVEVAQWQARRAEGAVKAV